MYVCVSALIHCFHSRKDAWHCSYMHVLKLSLYPCPYLSRQTTPRRQRSDSWNIERIISRYSTPMCVSLKAFPVARECQRAIFFLHLTVFEHAASYAPWNKSPCMSACNISVQKSVHGLAFFQREFCLGIFFLTRKTCPALHLIRAHTCM